MLQSPKLQKRPRFAHSRQRPVAGNRVVGTIGILGDCMSSQAVRNV
jgi:hypothetical protein